MVSGFVAVAISDIEASLYFVDLAWQDGSAVRPEFPDRHIVPARRWSAGDGGGEDPTFFSRLARNLDGASGIVLVGDEGASGRFMRYLRGQDRDLAHRIVGVTKRGPA